MPTPRKSAPEIDLALRSGGAVLVADDRGRYRDANDEASDLLGYSRQELLALSVWDLTPAVNEIDGLILWKDFIEVGVQAGVYWLSRKDGSVVELSYRAVANVVPGLHVSYLQRHDSLNEPFERSRFKKGRSPAT